ncbi:MAG: cytochrome c oxidase subunit II [Halobacteriales archaeon]
MEVHRFESVWAVVSVVLIVAWIGTVTYGAIGPGIAMVDGSGGEADAALIEKARTNDSVSFDEVDGFRAPGVYNGTGENSYNVYVVAYQFAFEPGSIDPIRVPKGANVTFYLTSEDVVHGFELVGTNVNTMAIPGQIGQFTVEFEEAGTYGIICNEYCGAQHHNMAGQLRVVNESEFGGGN